MPRIYGIETEYGIMGRSAFDVVKAIKNGVHHVNSGPTNDSIIIGLKDIDPVGRDHDDRHVMPYTLGDDQILSNGARFYVDMGHPEFSTPECADPLELVAYDRAGERIVEQCAGVAGARIFKNNTDNKGACYGCHENYLMGRITHDEFRRNLVSFLAPFFATRIIIAGAGNIIREGSYRRYADRSGGNGLAYHLSQRAEFIESLVGLQTTSYRPLINTRDEPHLDCEKYMRLHVICGDANLSEISTFLKIGITSAVLDLYERGEKHLVTLRDPVQAIKHISRDNTLKWIVDTVEHGTMSAVDIQRLYLAKAKDRLSKNQGSTQDVLKKWEYVLDTLAKNPMALADQLDWVIKKSLIEQMRSESDGAIDDILNFGVLYHEISPASIFRHLEKNGAVKRLTTDADVSDATRSPPTSTRRWLHTTLANKFRPVSADWSTLTYRLDNQTVTVHFDEPFDGMKSTGNFIEDDLETTLKNLRTFCHGIRIEQGNGKISELPHSAPQKAISYDEPRAINNDEPETIVNQDVIPKPVEKPDAVDPTPLSAYAEHTPWNHSNHPRVARSIGTLVYKAADWVKQHFNSHKPEGKHSGGDNLDMWG